MGCISSKPDIEDKCPNIFQVMNVDDHGNKLHAGQLEITDMDLVLFQRGKDPIKWPLRTLRRYGFDAEHFSFESGRRCTTGPGIYAFQCRRAEQLFNLLQSRIQTRNNDAELETPQAVPGNYLDPGLRRTGGRFSSQNGISTRLSSVGSTSGSAGPLSPQSTTSPPLPCDVAPAIPPLPACRLVNQNLYVNDEVIAAIAHDSDEANNNNKTVEPTTPPADLDNVELEDLHTYSLLEEMTSPTLDNSHLYMNIIPGTKNMVPDLPALALPTALPSSLARLELDGDSAPNYANLETDDLEGRPRRVPPLLLPSTPTGPRDIQYIVLDLEPGGSEPPKSPTSSLPPDSPRKPAEGYATIDFKKTVALSQSVNPVVIDSEASRKTRHDPSQPRHMSCVSD